jgi:superfamily II RNA helicase
MILSEFQKKAIQGIENGHHVLITAHTGSGKTLPAEHAIKFFTSQNKTVIYTSPIKALSNQKFNEFTKKFPELSVGILTGDNKHNPFGNVLVMTTEILQNKLFNPTSKLFDFDLNNLGCVIFDEVHYIDDEERGTVWEQSIIMLPDNVQMVMLSATIGEKEQFSGWIERIKNRKVIICGTNKRVVPLVFYNFFTCTKKNIEKTTDKSMKKLLEHNKGDLEIFCKDGDFSELSIEQNKKCVRHLSFDRHSNVSRKHVLNDLCNVLREKEMFPALCFVFSRKQVEEIAKEISVSLFMENEKDYEVEPVCRQLLVSRVTNWKEYMMLPEYEHYVNLLNKGIAIHHAGMLPVFREMIEILYEQKYIKLLIATETFAIGLNMPTKTVCFSSLCKHDGDRNRPLYFHEFTQMAGRAGRRNIDTIGHVILLSNLFEPFETTYYYKLTHSEPKVLKSKFKIGYNLVLHNSDTFNQQQMIEFVNKSLMTKDIHSQIQYNIKEISRLYSELENKLKLLILNDECKMYYCLEEKAKYSRQKEKNQIIKEMNNMKIKYSSLESQLILYNNIQDIKEQIQSLKNDKEYAENYITSQIIAIYDILKNNHYEGLKKKIAQSIHEVHPLVITELLYYTNFFTNYSSSDVFSILSCFYDVKVSDDYKLYNPSHFKQLFEYVNLRILYYSSKEVEYQLSSSGQDTIQYDLMDYVYEWMETCHDMTSSALLLEKLKNEKGLFTGDFIKCCLKLVNIAREIDSVCEDYPALQELLREGTRKILKFICTNESLYL